jgi:putative transposase
VLLLRKESKAYGKFKIAIILKRDHGLNISESTVGRILKHLMKKGLVTRSASAIRAKRKRKFEKVHAQGWTYKEYASMEIGERVQIDHMTVTKNNIRIKHFQAWDRKSKFIHAAVYSNATSAAAKKFLLELIQKLPFPIKSIQVDGGSEFMAHFENACKELNIPLIVLPPAKPQYNSGTERGNRMFREEFYEQPSFRANSLGEAKFELTKALHKYNHYRPHHNLDGLTPNEYINNYYPEIQNLSQMI